MDVAAQNAAAEGHATTAETSATTAANRLADIVSAKSVVQQNKNLIDGHATDAANSRDTASARATSAAESVTAA